VAIVNDVDFSIDRATGNIRHTGANTTTYTVLEFYTWLRDKGDDLTATGDDLFDMTDDDRAEKSFDTIIKLLGNTNIDQATSEYLYGGSIIEADGTIYDGITVIAPQGSNIDLIQNGAKVPNFWGTGLNADASKGISHKFIIKTSAAGTLIDGGKILGQLRTWQKDYQEFLINGTSRGENALPLATKNDLNNTSTLTSVANLAGFIITEGFQQVDANGSGTPQDYYMQIDRGANSVNDAYERLKWITRRGSTQTIFGLNGELFRGITHEVALTDLTTGIWVEGSPITWTSGTGQLLAIDNTSSGSATKMWIQLITGSAPSTETITNASNGATATSGTVTVKAVSKPVIGASTGTSIIGAYGVVFPPAQLTFNDKLTDLNDAAISPPNVQSGTITNMIVGDSIQIAQDDGSGSFDYAQFTLAAATLASATSVQVNVAIPSDTPTSGTIRVDDGTNRVRVAYTGFSGDTFTGCTGTPAASLGANTYISYIDEVVSSGTTSSYTASFLADRNLVCRVRNSADGIKTFKSPVTFKSSGFSLGVIRIPE